MGHDTAWCYGSRVRETGFYREFRQIGLQRLIDVNFSLFSQLHHRCRREQLGNRTYTVKCLRSRRHFVRRICVTKALRPDNALVVHQSDTQSGDVISFHFFLDQPGHILFCVFVIPRRDRRRLYGYGGAANHNSDTYDKEKWFFGRVMQVRFHRILLNRRVS